MELLRNKDGNYIDLAANIICNKCKTTRRKGEKITRILW